MFCGWHTAHHQELKKCNCSLWFHIRFWLPAAAMAQPSQRQPATKNVCKTRGCNYTFWAPDDGRCVTRKTCWVIKKHWNNKFYYTVASCWLFLWDLETMRRPTLDVRLLFWSWLLTIFIWSSLIIFVVIKLLLFQFNVTFTTKPTKQASVEQIVKQVLTLKTLN